MIKNSHRLATALALAAVCFFSTNALSKSVTFQREYTYQASEADSKLSSRVIALEQVKRLLLEELGTYLESETEVINYQLTKEKITTLTAGIVQTQIVDEKWDGREYWLRAKITAEPDKVAKSVHQLHKDRQKSHELEKARKKAEQLMKEITKLRKELALSKEKPSTKEQNRYDEAVDGLSALDWYEKAYAFYRSNEWEKVIQACTKAIKLNQRSAEALMLRGMAYTHTGQDGLAIIDCSNALEIKPNYEQAYTTRAWAYYTFKHYGRSIADCNKALEINPRSETAYAYRGNAYYFIGNKQQAKKDWITAARLGHRGSARLLNELRIEWQPDKYW
jgi:tetratricopeptide (TPR) repeat protein